MNKLLLKQYFKVKEGQKIFLLGSKLVKTVKLKAI